MEKNLKLGVLLLLILGTGWMMVFTGLPFWREVTVVAALSLIVMAVVHERYVFLYTMSAILSYGAFLAFYVFVAELHAVSELPYIYSHLLLTGFLLLYWVLMNAVKEMGYEQDELKRQISLLQKYTGDSELLTVNEFIEQASWLVKSSERKKEEIWFVEVSPVSGRQVEQSILDTMERTIQHTIRQKFDLVTSQEGTIYLLLKDTDEAGVDRVMERFGQNLKKELNLLSAPYQVKKRQLTDFGQLTETMGLAG